jgi:hypothetical protein
LTQRCMKAFRKKAWRKKAWRNTNGSILLVVIMIYSFLATALFLDATLILLDQMAADNTARAMKAFYVAEAGLAYAIASTRNNPIDLASLLLGADGIGGGAYREDDGLLPFGKDIPYGEGSFTVRVQDNEEPDGDPYSDTDNTFILSSTALLEPHIKKTLCLVLHCTPLACAQSAWLEVD